MDQVTVNEYEADADQDKAAQYTEPCLIPA